MAFVMGLRESRFSKEQQHLVQTAADLLDEVALDRIKTYEEVIVWIFERCVAFNDPEDKTVKYDALKYLHEVLTNQKHQ